MHTYQFVSYLSDIDIYVGNLYNCKLFDNTIKPLMNVCYSLKAILIDNDIRFYWR